MFLRNIFFLFILTSNSDAFITRSSNRDLISLILEFINKEQRPTSVNFHTCWPRSDILHIAGELWKNNHRLRIITDTDDVSLFSSPIVEHELILVDIKCKNVDRVFEKAETESLFKQPSRWIVIGNVSDIISRNLSIGVDSRFFVINEDGNNFHIYALFKYSIERTDIYSNEIATWSRDTGIEGYNELIIGRNRTDMKRFPLIISYVITNKASLEHLWDYREKHVDTISKLNFLVIHYLAEFLNATKVLIVHSTWGYKQKNSIYFDGMLGDLQNKTADIGATPFFFVHDRIPLVDYLASTYNTYMKFMFRAPPLSYIANIFTLPFDIYVWYSCLAISLLTLISIYLVLLWEYNASFKEDCKKNPQNTLWPTISEVTLFEISAISQQGYPTEPRSLAGRITMILIFGAVIFLYTSYSANIVVLLQSTSDSINSVEDLLTTRIELGVEDIVYAHHYFETTIEPTRKAVYDQKIAPKNQKANYMTSQEGIRRIQNEFFAFHTELSTGYKIIGDLFKESEKCGLRELTFVNVKEPWLPIQKNSTYKEIMTIGMRRLREHGIQSREASRLYTKKPICNVNNGSFVNVGLRECYFVFIIFVVGVLLSLIITVVENIMQKYLKAKLKTSNLTPVERLMKSVK
ncbi:hypothetical protein WA026_008455 [Henosepilachna vigintioctopunctata]|uniref:GRIP domain-containing protein n=1 Tax=Henosepilachna vigintioctopunctata TaxID=420089 RepID=A0AAW1UFW9_9CUCU